MCDKEEGEGKREKREKKEREREYKKYSFLRYGENVRRSSGNNSWKRGIQTKIGNRLASKKE